MHVILPTNQRLSCILWGLFTPLIRPSTALKGSPIVTERHREVPRESIGLG